MPRNVSTGIYTTPVGTTAVPDTTIESSKYNTNIADVEQDLNTPRPIVAGGTGAANARDAMTSLKGDLAYQVVTNFDTFAFVSGSFYAAAGATGAPVAGHAFTGICYTSDPAVTPPALPASNNLVIEARDQNDTVVPGLLYVREKKAGVWGAWVSSNVMGGYTEISYAEPRFIINKTASGQNASLGGSLNHLMRWAVVVGDATAETGSTAGSNFGILRYNDAGSQFTPAVMTIERATGIASFAYDMVVNGAVKTGASSTSGYYYFGNTTTNYLYFNGTDYILGGAGALRVTSGKIYSTSLALNPSNANGIAWDGGVDTFVMGGTGSVKFSGTGGTPIWGSFSLAGLDVVSALTVGTAATIKGDLTVYRNATPTTGVIALGNSTARTLSYDGTYFVFSGASASSTVGWLCRAGTGGTISGNVFNLEYNGNVPIYINAVNLGNLTFTSDYRIKKDVIDLPGMWDTVKALRPIKYTQAQYSPPSHLNFVKEQKEPSSYGPMFEADEIERWGFIAHELQETTIDSAATGVKDVTDAIQSPNPWTVIAALTKALQEAMTRIEALEAQ